MQQNMDKKAFDFWTDHSSNYLEMAFRADRFERVKNPDGYGKNKGVCGDTIEMFLDVKNGIIQHVSIDTDGCINTRACANAVAYMAEGKTTSEAWKITPEKIIDFLETLPSDSAHCAELAVGALYLALANHNEIKRSPWKKMYGNS